LTWTQFHSVRFQPVYRCDVETIVANMLEKDKTRPLHNDLLAKPDADTRMDWSSIASQ
jgi:hypothetical protein